MLNVFDIQYSSFHDGPGIRTVVFLKGCNLSCVWCQNPESQHATPELMHFDAVCIGCGHCLSVCPKKCFSFQNRIKQFDRASCDACGKCAEVCPTGALELCGKKMSESEIMKRILRDKQMYALSGGGLTISGGEPLLQAEGCRELLMLAKEEGLHTAIETAACLPTDHLQCLLPYLDLVLCDVKTIDEAAHKEACGGTNRWVRENLQLLNQAGVETQVRIPVIPNWNDTEASIKEITKFCGAYTNITDITLIPFHKLGAGKYSALDRYYIAGQLDSPSEVQMQKLHEALNVERKNSRKEEYYGQ